MITIFKRSTHWARQQNLNQYATKHVYAMERPETQPNCYNNTGSSSNNKIVKKATKCATQLMKTSAEFRRISRVHQFTKVEMFSICSATQSEHMIECFKNLQLELFKKLALKLRLLDMPPNELGASAYQKYDIEAWMPGRATWGEISSCSNCTDYQAKRLNIRYRTREGDIKYTHTVNGTAAAIPRLLIGLLETHQVDSNIIQVPEVVAKYMETDIISKAKFIPEIKLIKHLKNDM